MPATTYSPTFFACSKIDPVECDLKRFGVLVRFELIPGAEFLLFAHPPSKRVPIKHPRISSARSTTTLASNQVAQ